MKILHSLQQIISKLPKVINEDFKKIISCKSNDNYLCMYVGSIVKGIINIHTLLNNRIKVVEDKEEEKREEEKMKKIKDSEDKKLVDVKTAS